MDTGRKRTPLYVAGVIILVFVFLVFFGGPLLELGTVQQSKIVFGKYRNREIAYIPGNYFALSVANARNQALRLGSEIDTYEREIWRQGFDETLFYESLLYLAAQNRMNVSDSIIDSAIAANPEFQNESGFDINLWRGLTQTQRLRIRENTREQLLHQQVLTDIQEGSLISPHEVEFVESIARREISIRLVTFNSLQLTNADIERYVAQNSANFTRLRVQKLVLSGSRNNAQNVYEQISADGTNLGRLIDEYSIEEDAGGWYYLHEIRSQYPALEEVERLTEFPLGVSPILSTPNNLHFIFWIEEKIAPEGQNSETLVEDARAYLTNRDTQMLLALLSEKAEEFTTLVHTGESFDNAANQYNLVVETSEYFGINYSNSDLFAPVEGDSQGVLESAAYSEDFFVAVFSLAEGEVTPPLQIGDSLMVAQLRGERTVDGEYSEVFDRFYRSQSATWQESDARRILLKPEFVRDNFDEVYTRSIATSPQ